MSLIDHIAAAPDLAALDALRVAALGKSGEITALLKSLGGMTPDERSVEGPKIHARREEVTAAITAVGPACGICPRMNCPQRATAPAGRALAVDENRKTISPYPFVPG